MKPLKFSIMITDITHGIAQLQGNEYTWFTLEKLAWTSHSLDSDSLVHVPSRYEYMCSLAIRLVSRRSYLAIMPSSLCGSSFVEAIVCCRVFDNIFSLYQIGSIQAIVEAIYL